MKKLCLGYICLLLSAGSVQALEYRLQIEGPEADELTQALDWPKSGGKDALSAEQLPRQFQRSQQQLREILATQGYFSARIDSSLSQDEQGRWQARYRIERGDQARVASLQLEFAGDLQQQTSPQQALRKSFALQPGAYFSQALWREAKRQLQEAVSARDYPFAHWINTQARVEGDQVHLQLVLDSGKPARFHSMSIEGLQRLPEQLVWELAPFKLGDPYQRDDVYELQRRLQKTQYFDVVLVEARPDPDQADQVRVKVQLSEQNRYKYRVGLGYNSDHGARITLEHENRNILDSGWRWRQLLRLDQQSRTGTSEISLPPGHQGRTYSLGFTYKQEENDNNVEGDGRIQDRSQTTTRRYFASSNQGTAWRENITSAEWTNETQWLHYIPADGSSAYSETVQVQNLNLGQNWVFRGIDELIFPRRGLVEDYSVQLGARISGNLDAAPFTRIRLRWQDYRSLAPHWRWVHRLELGQIIGNKDQIPADSMFTAGGDNSVRGYPYKSLGLSSEFPLGSPSMLLASHETQYWLDDTWGAAVFVDTANLGATLAGQSWNHGYGAGLRVRTPVGPLQFDLGWGQRIHKYQFHFSLGLAF